MDNNRVQATGPIAERMDIGDVRLKWESFGWQVIELDGHNINQICDALDQADDIKDRPVLLLANTLKGKGITFAEGQAAFHNGALTHEQAMQAHADIDAM